MSHPIRIAHVIDVMDSGGIEAVVMNYYRNIDKSKVQFDFITSDISKLPQRDEIEKLGGRIYLTPRYTKLLAYNKRLKEIFTQNKYQVVHCHMGTLAIFPLRIAKKCGVKVRICHAHSTTNKKEWKRNLIKKILKPFAKVYANEYFACGELAGKWLFGTKTFDENKVTIMHNAINVDKFKYDEKIREKVRRELGVDDNYVVGHIGRFVTQKNHDFLIELFKDISLKNEKAILLLVGEGPLEEEIKNKVESYNIGEKVKFLGVRKDCNELYQAMDIFLLPSLYEGLPVVGVEAQCSGLKCIFSDQTTKEIEINKNVLRYPLDKKEWLDNVDGNDAYNRTLGEFKLDIKVKAKEILDKYLEMVGE